jgi:tetratricopeptide (TPR) repeat protein
MNTPRFVRAGLLAGAIFLVSGLMHAETAETLMAKGDVFDKQLKTKEALENYLPAEKLEPKSAELMVRISRQYRHLMSDTSDKNEKLRLGHIALDYAQRAATLGPNDSDAQLAPAISYGKMLPLLGSKEQVDASPRIKQSLDRALQLNPKNDTAWHILARWNRVLADINPLKRLLAGALYGKLPVTTYEAAEKAILTAISINPNRSMHYIELGRIYAAMGRKDDAKKFLSKGMAMPNREKDDWELKEVARDLLKKLG